MKSGLIAAACAFLFAGRLAFGAETAEPDRGMREHFAAGVRLYDAKDYERALAEFEAAYKAKAVAAIERNIALTLEKLGRYPEAVDALERFVVDAGSSMKPEVRSASEAKLRELGARVATVRVHVLPAGATVRVDGTARPADDAPRGGDGADLRLHLSPGEHVFSASAEGFVPGEVRRVLAGGEDASVAIDLAPAAGAGTTLAALPGAVPAQPSPEQAMALAPLPPATPDVLPPAPPPYEAAGGAARRPRASFFAVGLGFGAEVLRMSPGPLGGGTSGSTPGTWGSAGLSVALGRELTSVVTVFGYGEIDGASNQSAYYVGGRSWSVGMADLLLAPGIRLHTTGKRVRLFGDVAGGLDVRWVNAKDAQGQATGDHVSGSGAGLALLGAAGLEVRLPSVYVAAQVGLLFHDVRGVRSDSGPLFADGGAARADLRFTLGFPF